MEPLASLSVSKKGALTWVENYGLKEKAKWLKLDGHKSTKASPYFKLPDGRIGFFIAYHAVVLGNGITVLHDLRDYHDSRIFTGARPIDSPTSSDDEIPPSYEDAIGGEYQ
ncbi:hypothetical protein Pmar_PMAR024560 [Perkinsus marinus ATCC 50983]|uniref:Uncharacterized protein n=1 Tax=Perkinsus marinus (strain ATCC 50983 / TXsc) TaxID=423536 RepID=C5LTB5_PERM5|nr:hypothetical protein Pmar_PMAR024560 [Perkinsus marinus ATCC 50983]EER00083.1 hypothetical protein Pmar_PMAR024560 [Perkinsus marinus ATCC 50983]|eukprot:XP_002767365.1 hypothetical protein Pmar_PMAR024560 [Perkinsus marinus ATCC 50983]